MRGQYGLYVTTSYFTKQAQEEVFEDRYPARLFAGADVVRFMRELRLVKGAEISETWLSAIAARAGDRLACRGLADRFRKTSDGICFFPSDHE